MFWTICQDKYKDQKTRAAFRKMLRIERGNQNTKWISKKKSVREREYEKQKVSKWEMENEDTEREKEKERKKGKEKDTTGL